MPVIPFQNRPEVEPEHASGAFRREQATPGDFGAHRAAGLESVGGAGQRAGDVMASNAIAFQRQQNETDVDAANTAFEAKKREVLFEPGGFYDKKGKDAYDSMGSTAKSIEDLRAEVRGGMTNPEQQRMFDTISRRSTEMDLRAMSRHAAAQNQEYRVGVAEASIQNAQAESAAYWNDPYRFALSVGNIKIHAENRARLMGRTDPEEIKADVNHYVGQAWVARIKGMMQHDPIAAEQMFKANAGEIGDLGAKVQLEHELKAAVMPVQAKNVAQSIITGAAGEQPKAPELVPVKGGAEDFPKETPPQSLERAQASLGLLQKEQAERPNDEALGREISRTQKLITDLSAKQPQLPGTVPVGARDTKAMLAAWIPAAEREADRQRPGDVVFRDAVLAQVKGYVNTIALMQEAQAKQAYGTLTAAARGTAGGPKPMTLDDLLKTPDARSAWALMDPPSQAGIMGLLEHNAKNADLPDYALYHSLRDRLWLPDSDPQKITSPAQLAPYMGRLGFNGAERIQKELAQAQSPEGNAFVRDVHTVETAAKSELVNKAAMLMRPEAGQEAAWRFHVDLQQKIEKYRAEKKEPRDLITPGKPDYVLSPEHIASFMSSGKAAIAESAKSAYVSGQTYTFKQGKMKFKGGDANDPKNWEAVK
jgi:hypothetical protein